MDYYCNPLNLEYKYQHYGKAAHREVADPTLILFKGTYYLFASMSAGFYYSKDLLHWSWHENRNLELYHYAPDVRQAGEWLIFCASDRHHSTIWRTKDPFADTYEKVSEPFAFWDPDTFVDDDGRVYFYWGCDSGRPIYGIELDSKTFLAIGEKKALIFGQSQEHGFERQDFPGREAEKPTLAMRMLYKLMELSGRGKDAPFIEGAFMSKINGKYYLQYAAPATEVPTYGNGVYIGENPMGPFVYQQHNPMSSKPGGFITGAGHGSTIQDAYGNWWHAASMRISVNASFERRVGLFPAGVDEDGILYCNQNYADWPLQLPQGKFDPMNLRPAWMLLSYKKTGTASSATAGHGVELALNEDIRSCWCAEGCKGEWYKLDLGGTYTVCAVQIDFADVDVPVLKKPRAERSDLQTSNRYIDSGRNLRTRWLLEGSTDGNEWFVLQDKRRADSDLAHDCLYFEAGVRVRYLRLTAEELPYHEKFALSGLRVFGLPHGKAPAAVETVTTARMDATTAQLSWPRADYAVGYNVRYGIAPDKLYASYLVYETPGVVLTMLNKDQTYYFAVDSFGEGGITEGTPQRL